MLLLTNLYCYFIRYNERLSKNYKVKLGHCQDEHFRPPVMCYSQDVVETWRAYDYHLSDGMKDGPFFLSAIDGPTSRIWYKKTKVGLTTISSWLKVMAQEAEVTRRITNKTGRRTAISRMALTNMPREIMMQITWHKSASSLDQYDDTLDVSQEAAMRALDVPEVPQVEVQYSTLKKQVTQEFIEHHVVRVPTSVGALKGVASEAEKEPVTTAALTGVSSGVVSSLVAARTTDLTMVPYDPESELHVYSSCPPGSFLNSVAGPSNYIPGLGGAPMESVENQVPTSAF
jgi:hypothetical protein